MRARTGLVGFFLPSAPPSDYWGFCCQAAHVGATQLRAVQTVLVVPSNDPLAAA